MKVLIACEFSGIVRNAFVSRGHDAWSCDLLPEEQPRPDGWNGHYQGDIFECLNDMPEWDLMIAHPPCTYLCNSGIRWLYKEGNSKNGPDHERWTHMQEATDFYLRLYNVNIKRKCLENPRMHRYAIQLIGHTATQFIQPRYFGHEETKETGLDLVNLPPLNPTSSLRKGEARVHTISPGPDRWKERSRTLLGIAEAMAEQWG